MPNTLLSDVWDETRRFLAREFALILPVALMTLGFGFLLFVFAVPPMQNNALPDGPWVFWALPSALFVLVGFLALSELAVTSGSSVAEALRLGFRTLPRGIAMVLIVAGGSAVVLVLVIAVLMALGMAPAVAMRNALSIFTVLNVIVGARVALAYALLVKGRGPLAALAESWRLTTPVRWRLALLMFGFVMMSGLLLVIVQVAAGSLFLLLGRLAGLQTLGTRLTDTSMALLWSMLQMGWLVFTGLLCRRLIRTD